MSQGKLRKEWLEENGSFFMTRLSQPQLLGRVTIRIPPYSLVKATSEVFRRGICLDLDHHVRSPQDSPFWSRDHRDIPIESSEINSHPRLPINANQIKWFKTHILFLDFDWCPIKVMLTLNFKWTSIGSLRWIALPTHSSLMKCEAFYLRKGWVERCSFPSWPKFGIIHLAHRVTCWRSLNVKYDRQLYS